jgi:amino acid adenylation domain-containing protein
MQGPNSTDFNDAADARKRLLNLLLAARAQREPHCPTIPRRPAAMAAVPLSFAQEGLWILEQLDLHADAYNVPVVLKLVGEIDVDALKCSLVDLTRRHEILRTRFALHGTTPVQVIETEGAIDFKFVDLSGGGAENAARRGEQMSRDEAQRPFDVAVGPLFRALLLRLGPREHLLLLTIHHIVADGWSIGILTRELGALYSARRAQEAGPLDELPLQYADFCIWQREWLQGARLEEDLQYWKDVLMDAPAALELPTDRSRPAIQSFRGAAVHFIVPLELVERLKALGRRAGATPFMVFLAAYQILLSRWSGQKDLVVGTAVAGRTAPQLEGLVGLFANLLALRTDLSGNPSFHSLLDRVKETTLGAYAHQSAPFERIVQELRPQRLLSRHPIVQVTLGLQNFPRPDLHLDGLRWTSVDVECTRSKFDLSLDLYETTTGLAGALVYATDLFEPATAERMMKQFCTLLQSIASSAGASIAELQMLPTAERDRLLLEWNRTATTAQGARCVHELFSEQVARSPDEIAVIQRDRSLTYRQLELRSNQFARHLRSLGINSNAVVGLYMQRSPEMVVALLGTLKAGAAYLPLDVSHPRERILAVLADSGARVLVTMDVLAFDVSAVVRDVVRLDSHWPMIACLPDSSVDSEVTPLDLAYVIYTSGSTGAPKGVTVAHAALLNYVLWALRTYEPTSGDGIPISSPLAFDATATGLYSALLSGRPAILAPDGEELEALEALLLQPRRLSFIKVAPAHLNALGARLASIRPPCSVNMIVVGGELLTAATVAQWRSFWPQVRIFNQYGPTETVVACTAFEIPLEWQMEKPIPIGRPVWNVHVYVLDDHMQLVPIGAVGELYVAGRQLSNGYLGQAALTKERFVPDPFGPPGTSMYRTGDLVRYQSDGNLEYVGRADRQVKLRGYRIEPAEIETALLRHHQVSQAVVVARDDAPGDKRLVAYIVRNDRPDAAAGEPSESFVPPLREYMRARVPEYMVPSAWVVLSKIPLTTNGKVDQRALPAPQGRTPEGRLAPRTDVERAVAIIWAELLGLESVGVRDNFFELGGSSLHGMKLASAIAQRCGVRLSAVAVFKHQTVEEMAALIAGSLRSTDAPSQGTTPAPEAGFERGEL